MQSQQTALQMLQAAEWIEVCYLLQSNNNERNKWIQLLYGLGSAFLALWLRGLQAAMIKLKRQLQEIK